MPVLLVHGDMDQNVEIEHSEKMASALEGGGQEGSNTSRIKGLDHQLDDSNAREQMLTTHR